MKPTLLTLPLRVEPGGEEARHAGHHNVGHERDHHQGKDQRAQDRVKIAENGIEDHEHHGGEREDREPGYQRHLVARRRWIAFLGGKRKPGFEASEDAYVGLLLDELLGLVEPVVAFPGLFPALEVARVVELEDDLVFVVFGAARTDDVRTKITGKPVRRRENTGDPLLELPLTARLYAPRRYRRDGWIFAFSGISMLFELVQERYSNGSYRNTVLLNPKPSPETTRQRAKTLAMHQKEAA